MKLLDASVAAKLALDEIGWEAARALSLEPICAPELILVETANAWWKACRNKALSAEAMQDAVRNLSGVFEALYPTAPVLEHAAEVARMLDHPIYDCVYLAYARVLELPIVTADRRLLAKVGGTEFEDLCEPLLA